MRIPTPLRSTTWPIRFLTWLTLCLTIGLANADGVNSFAAEYTISNGEYSVGKATLVLKRDGDKWSMQLATEPTGLFTLMSRGYTTETSVLTGPTPSENGSQLPLSYSYHQKKGKPERNLNAEFLSAANVVSVINEAGVETALKTSGPVHDPLSSMLETMRLLRKGERDTISLQVFSRGEIKTHELVTGEVETLQTEAGEFPAIRVTRTHSGSARETRIWYAPSVNYAPVKIEQHKRGELVARLLLKSMK